MSVPSALVRVKSWWPKEGKWLPLGVSADQLLGLEKPPRHRRVRDTRLWRRFRQVEQLPPVERKPIVHLVDAFLRGKKAGAGG